MSEQSFVLLDLISQGLAVQAKLAGLPLEQKLQWIAGHGKLWGHKHHPGFPDGYHFESRTGQEANFFFDGDVLVFIGDHTTFTAQ